MMTNDKDLSKLLRSLDDALRELESMSMECAAEIGLLQRIRDCARQVMDRLPPPDSTPNTTGTPS